MQLPDQLLLRRRDVMNYLGFSKYMIEKLKGAGVLKPVKTTGHDYYLRDDIIKLEKKLKGVENGQGKNSSK